MGDKEGGGHMLNAELEDEMECVFVCVFEGPAVVDKSRINSSRVRAPASPGNPVSPPRGYGPTSMCRILITSIAFCTFLVALHRRLESCPDSLLIPVLSFIGVIVVGPVDSDEGGVSVANANPLRTRLFQRGAFVSSSQTNRRK